MGTFANAATANDYMTGRKPLPSPDGQEVVSVRFTIALGTGDLDASDIGAFAKLPAGCVPVDALIDMTDMDSSTAALVLTFGVLTTAAATALSTVTADGGGAWGATTASAAAATQRLTFTGNNMMNVASDPDTDRLVGCIVTTAPTTAVAGTLGLTLHYRNA
jgi:hypothetical protein